MIQPLKLGSITFASNLIQGPLAGVSCAPFRKLAYQYGCPAFCCTEMVSAKHLVSAKATSNRYTYKAPEEGALCFQISGNEISLVAKTAERATRLGADLIDLNAGCPVPKMRAKGVGSKLLHTPEKLYHLTQAMRHASDAVISVKVRVNAGKGDIDNLAVLDAIEQGGADYITVHGRHWTQGYDVNCDYEEVRAIVKAASIPVIGNGDVKDLSSLRKMLATGCAGVMIGRAGVGQPWLFEKLRLEMNNKPFVSPSFFEVSQIFLDHLLGLIALENETIAIYQSRKFFKYYFRPYLTPEVFARFENEYFQLKSFTSISALVEKYANENC